MFSHLMNSKNYKKRIEIVGGIPIHLYRPLDVDYLRSWVQVSRYVAEEYRDSLLAAVELIDKNIDTWIRFE